MKIFYFKICSIFLVLLTLLGCSVPLSAENAKSIHTIKIDKHIYGDKKLLYGIDPDTFAQQIQGHDEYRAFGILNNTFKFGQEEINTAAQNGHISIDQIVLAQLTEQMEQKIPFRIVQNGPADANLKIEIKSYGLQTSGPPNHYMTPMLKMEAELLRQDKIVWKNSSTINARTAGLKIPSYTLQDIKENPRRLFELWNIAASKAVTKILATL